MLVVLVAKVREVMNAGAVQDQVNSRRSWRIEAGAARRVPAGGDVKQKQGAED